MFFERGPGATAATWRRDGMPDSVARRVLTVIGALDRAGHVGEAIDVERARDATGSGGPVRRGRLLIGCIPSSYPGPRVRIGRIGTRRDADALGTGTRLRPRIDRRHEALAGLRFAVVLRPRVAGRPRVGLA